MLTVLIGKAYCYFERDHMQQIFPDLGVMLQDKRRVLPMQSIYV